METVWMARLYELITAAQEGDFVHVSAWDFDLNVYLDPGIPGDQTRLGRTLTDAMRRGVIVRLLVSSNVIQYRNAAQICAHLNEVCDQCCVADSRHADITFGSAHVKQWVVKLGKRLISFLGSDDIAPGRWDSSNHDLNDPRWSRQPMDAFRMFAWHSMMYEIEGQAAWDLEQIFWYRWHDPSPPNLLIPSMLRPEKTWLAPYTLISTADIDFPPEGDLEVQVVRTFGCLGARSGLYQNFSPYGDYSFAALWHKSLHRARKYIYLADQFLYFPDAMQAVVDALTRIDFLIVLTNTGSVSRDLDVFRKGHEHQQWRALVDPITQKDPSLREKVFMFSLARDHAPHNYGSRWQIYNHEKTLIIDDEFAFIGSSGEDSSSFTSDIDAHLGIASPKFAKALRIRMMAEHLQISREDPRLQDPRESLHLFVENAATHSGRLRHYWPTQPLTFHYWLFNFGMAVFFVEGRCPDLKDMWPSTWDYGDSKRKKLISKKSSSFLPLIREPTNINPQFSLYREISAK